ncbi:RagB/SusD family nutrient uptake outer membrane protein [Carboxylicivirga marina]|uniref:RagB/SusD family nutrient uptake outer membrane protein n=1 Tax=Carboxylicivirga marina TaxID=2800988 RepID=UPI0025986929|nr:RagB/SusD family nutrient uptake outer membrane protein [uncultured Carboxylicivirga sp.]
MKIFNYILTVVGVLAIFSSCEKLDFGNAALEAPPTVSVTVDTVFSKIEYAEQFLWGAYTSLPHGIPAANGDEANAQLIWDNLSCLTDVAHSFMTWGGCARFYYVGNYSAVTENHGGNVWNGALGTKYNLYVANGWKGIRQAYLFIENIDKVPDATEAYKKQLIAEAKMIIAVHYTEMYRHYGGLPWVDKAYTVADDTNLPRSTARETLDNIVALCDEAATDLPVTITDPNWDGRFTRVSALGLKARVLLFGASPLFNDDTPFHPGQASEELLVWHGAKDNSLWQDAADAAVELINVAEGAGYGLYNKSTKTGVDKYREDFRRAYYDRGNDEILISTRVTFRLANTIWGNKNIYFGMNSTPWGTGGPTNTFVEMFGMANGLPITDPASGYNPGFPERYQNRDPRLYETVVVHGDMYKGAPADLTNVDITGHANSAKSGYIMRKFWLDRNTATSLGSVVQYPYLRLPEVYLSAAEALNEVNSGPTAEAYSYVDKVRARVGLPGLQTGLSQAEFREAVLEERTKELGYEQVRWFDLVRWKREDRFTSAYSMLNLTKNNGVVSAEEVNTPTRFLQSNFSPKWYLSAFPTDEVNKGYGIVQNPGWEQ